MLTKIQNEILFHLGYEWWMFRSTFELLRCLPDEVDPVRNALVESLAIHGRGLKNFFYGAKKEESDWHVNDLIPGRSVTVVPSALDHWTRETNKRVAHLTETRKDPLVAWNVLPVLQLLEKNINEIKIHFSDDMPSDWIGDRSTNSTILIPPGPSGPTPIVFGGILGGTGPAGPGGYTP